ncbi:MAG: tetratricopeptide repeat protein [Bacilli bacterium]|nr:tetratricopeptide repeat protein [Bacilli bacterium]
MEQNKYGKLPSSKNNPTVQFHKKREELYLEGLDYLNGKNGKDKNPEIAYKLIKQSADMDYAYAINAIGSFYYKGLVVKQSYDKARELYLAMRERLNPKAAYNLMVIYRRGMGVEANKETAQEYFQDAVRFACREIFQGRIEGMNILKNDLKMSDGQIRLQMYVYKINPICEFCHGPVQRINLWSSIDDDTLSSELSDRLLESARLYEFDTCDPLMEDGFCCGLCNEKYMVPIKKAYFEGVLSTKEMAVLRNRDDMVNAIQIFLKCNS